MNKPPCPRCGDPQSNRIDGVKTRRCIQCRALWVADDGVAREANASEVRMVAVASEIDVRGTPTSVSERMRLIREKLREAGDELDVEAQQARRVLARVVREPDRIDAEEWWAIDARDSVRPVGYREAHSGRTLKFRTKRLKIAEAASIALMVAMMTTAAIEVGRGWAMGFTLLALMMVLVGIYAAVHRIEIRLEDDTLSVRERLLLRRSDHRAMHVGEIVSLRVVREAQPSELAMPQAINAEGGAFNLGSWMQLRAALSLVQQLEQELGLAGQAPRVRVAMDAPMEVEVSADEREHQASE